MLDIAVVDDPQAVTVALDPVRAQILRCLAEPGSATTVAAELGLSRQKANYHLRALESHGLVELVEERPRRGVTERIVRSTARRYVVTPSVLDDRSLALDGIDRLSSRYLVALAARLVHEVVDLTRRADGAGKSLPTLAIDTDIRFRSADERAAFSAELAATIRDLASRYHDECADGGRWHRLIVGSHPHPHPPVPERATT